MRRMLPFVILLAVAMAGLLSLTAQADLPDPDCGSDPIGECLDMIANCNENHGGVTYVSLDMHDYETHTHVACSVDCQDGYSDGHVCNVPRNPPEPDPK